MYFHFTVPLTLSSITNPHMGKGRYNKMILLSVEASNIVPGSYAKMAKMAG